MSVQDLNIHQILPELLLFCLALGVLVADMFFRAENKKRLWDISFLGLLMILMIIIIPFTGTMPGDGEAFGGQAINDGLTLFMRLIIISTLFIALIFSVEWLEKNQKNIGIYIFLSMISAFGAMVMCSAGDFLVLFIGLELLSVPLYILAGFDKNKEKSREASFKYFILGSFASAFLALGISLVYASTSLLEISDIAKRAVFMPFTNSPSFKIGIGLIIATLAFKGGLMPFYAWIPDVYRGSPDYVVGFMAAVAKVAAFGGLIRVGTIFYAIPHSTFADILIPIFVLTVIVGNLMALWQEDVKRMLAYSSIAHAGYLLLGLFAFNQVGLSAILFYLVIYSFTVMGSFIITGVVCRLRGGYELSHFDGLRNEKPGLAFAMTVFMFTLAGIPPLAGFFSKFFIFNAAVDEGYWKLVIVASLASLIGVYYYLRVIVRIYMKPIDIENTYSGEDVAKFYTNTAIFVVCALVIILGVLPGRFYDAAHLFLRTLFM